MKKIISLILAICMLLCLCACGDKGGTDSGGGDKGGADKVSAADPALGVYQGVSYRLFDSLSDMSEVYSGTNSITLEEKGKCTVTLEDDSVKGEYTLENGVLNVVIEGTDSPGTLKDSVLTIDFMGLGMDLIFVKEGAEIPEEVKPFSPEDNDDPNLIPNENSEARYLESKIVSDANGDATIAMYFDYVCTGSVADSFGWSYYYTLKQGDQELESTTVLREDNSYLSETVYQDVQPGEHLEVCLTYVLADTVTPVVVTFTDLFDKVLQEITVDLSQVEILMEESSSEAGYYTLYSFEEDGEVVDLEQLAMIGIDKTTFVVFNEDGTGRINFDGDESELSYDGETIYNIGGDMSYFIEGDYLTILTGNLIFVFVRSDEEPPAPGTVLPAGSLESGENFPAEVAAEAAGDWHGMAVIYEATGEYASIANQEMEIIARFSFDEAGLCTPFLAAALSADSAGNFENISASYNPYSDGMMLTGSFASKEIEDYSNAYTYLGALYLDVYIDDGAGNYLNLYACLKPLDAEWDENTDYPCLPAGAVEFYRGMSLEEIAELFGLDPAVLPPLR